MQKEYSAAVLFQFIFCSDSRGDRCCNSFDCTAEAESVDSMCSEGFDRFRYSSFC